MAEIKMILTNAFDPDVRVYKEAKFLVDHGHHVEILCWDREGEYIDRESETVDGIQIKRFYIGAKYGSGFKQLSAFLKFRRVCGKYIRNCGTDFLHCHDLDGVIAGYSCGRKVKAVFDMHENYINRYKGIINLFIRFFVNRGLRKSYKVIYVDNRQIEFIEPKFHPKLIYLPNYPIQKLYFPLEKTPSDRLRINYIGSVRDYEALINLLEATKEMDRVSVGIYGNGVAYERLCMEKNNYSQLTLYGKYDGMTDSGKIFRNTDVVFCVYSSQPIQQNDGYAVKFYESIVCETPLIVNRESVMGEFVSKYNIGYCLDCTQSGCIKKCIQRIIENPEELELKKLNLKAISMKYKWESVIPNLLQAYA